MEPETKDAQGSQAVHPDVLISRAVREIKASFPELIVITDIALDPYTSHGHDGILNKEGTEVLNDETVCPPVRNGSLAGRDGCRYCVSI